MADKTERLGTNLDNVIRRGLMRAGVKGRMLDEAIAEVRLSLLASGVVLRVSDAEALADNVAVLPNPQTTIRAILLGFGAQR